MSSPPPPASSATSSPFDLSRLSSSNNNSALFSALVDLRARLHPRRAGSRRRGRPGGELVRRLVRLLGRPNSKIVDVTLSILGNLMLEEAPRKAVSKPN